MNDSIQIKIANVDQIKVAFYRAPELMRVALSAAINKSLLMIGKQAAINAPVKTGTLRASILDPDKGLQLSQPTLLMGYVGAGVNYGIFVESGTRFMRAQPFLKPAVETSDLPVQGLFVEAVDGVLKAIGDVT